MAEAVVVRVFASFTALIMCLSPAAEMRRIHARRVVGCMPALPLVAQWLYNHTWFDLHSRLAYLLELGMCLALSLADRLTSPLPSVSRMLYGFAVREYFPLLATYAVGSALSVVFLSIFYLHAHEQRAYVLKLSVAALALNVAATVFAVAGPTLLRTSSVVTNSVGALAIFYGALLYASPLATVVAVVRTKSAESIPLAMVGVGAVSNAVWIVYGCLLSDPLVTAPAVVNAGFCALQLGLCAVYHPKRESLKAAVARLHRRLARRQPTAERDVSGVHLETPKYEELQSPTALCA